MGLFDEVVGQVRPLTIGGLKLLEEGNQHSDVFDCNLLAYAFIVYPHVVVDVTVFEVSGEAVLCLAYDFLVGVVLWLFLVVFADGLERKNHLGDVQCCFYYCSHFAFLRCV